MRFIFASISGLIFGFGLALAGMLNPSKVQGFLNIFGVWDPSLAFVMGGGIIVNAIGYYFVLKRDKPLFAEKFALPTTKNIDKNLLIGSAVFGIGWGLAGLCPGPVISNVLLQPQDALIFLIIMIFGLFLGRRVRIDNTDTE
ncbi:MAG: YeeE/YedE family protein [Alphaproteobacteria bacterium]|nr:YeeE/YedE family protein [Alphaproteobacteria bacterium]